MAIALFVVVSALGGGFALSTTGAPPELLAHTPFASFLVPALLLVLVVGGTSLACAVLVLRRSPGAIDATILAGGALTIWIVAEASMFREVHWLHLLYGGAGLVLLGLGVVHALAEGHPRHRWILSVTLAETVGFLAPVAAGLFLRRPALVAIASLAEGFCLGAGQAWAFPIGIHRLRYAILTALGGAITWLAVLSTIALGPAAIVAGALGVVVLGFAQWIELRDHTRHAESWIVWTALAWMLALPCSFAPAPFVDEATPAAAALALWACGGAIMAYVMAVVTWEGVRRSVMTTVVDGRRVVREQR